MNPIYHKRFLKAFTETAKRSPTLQCHRIQRAPFISVEGFLELQRI